MKTPRMEVNFSASGVALLPRKVISSHINKWYFYGTVPLSHIHIIFTVYIVLKPPKEWV